MTSLKYASALFILTAGCATEIQSTPEDGWAIDETVQIETEGACAQTQTVQMDDLSLVLEAAPDFEIIDVVDQGELEIPDGSVVAFSKALVSSPSLSVKPIKYTITCTSSCDPIEDIGTCASSGCKPVYPSGNKAPYCTDLICSDPDYCGGSCTQTISAVEVGASKK